MKEDINELKSKFHIQVIKQLQESFTSIFPGYSFEIESDTEINFTITRGENKFRLENSASGYFEVLYMLNLLRDNRGIVILDEPALHLHPIKQKHFWKVVRERNNNQLVAITHSPYLVNLDLFNGDNRLINVQMIDGVSEIFPKPHSNLRTIRLNDYNFEPEIFFSQCNIIVEGPSDEAAIAAISDSLDGPFEKYSIHTINVSGKDTIENYVPLLEAYSIPHVVLTDYDYFCDDEKQIIKKRKKPLIS